MNKVTMPNQDRDCITCSKHLPAQKIPHECHVCLNATENLKGYYLPLWEPIMSKSYDAAWRTEEAKQIVDLIEKTEATGPVKALDVQVGGNHYKGMAIQPVEFATANRLDFFQKDIVKYVTRKKGDLEKRLEDLNKAKHYIDLYMDALKGGY